MALLPQDQQSQQRFLVVIVVLGAAAAYWMYLWQPKQQELTEMEDRVAQLEHHNRTAQARSGNLDRLRAELRQAEQTYRVLQELVPPRGEVARIYESIAGQIQSLGMELNRVTPATPQPVEGESYYQRQRWQMEVEGEYHTVGQFLTRVASLDRIVRPEILEMRPATETPSGRQPVVVSLALEMFVIPPDTTEASGGQPSGEGGGAGESD